MTYICKKLVTRAQIGSRITAHDVCIIFIVNGVHLSSKKSVQRERVIDINICHFVLIELMIRLTHAIVFKPRFSNLLASSLNL